jgi:hypothetical protein
MLIRIPKPAAAAMLLDQLYRRVKIHIQLFRESILIMAWLLHTMLITRYTLRSCLMFLDIGAAPVTVLPKAPQNPGYGRWAGVRQV